MIVSVYIREACISSMYEYRLVTGVILNFCDGRDSGTKIGCFLSSGPRQAGAKYLFSRAFSPSFRELRLAISAVARDLQAFFET